MIAEAIEDLNPFSLPVETPRREPSKRDVPSKMENPVPGFWNDGHFASEAELVIRGLNPPVDLSRIVREDLLNFRSADVRCREEVGEVFASVG